MHWIHKIFFPEMNEYWENLKNVSIVILKNLRNEPLTFGEWTIINIYTSVDIKTLVALSSILSNRIVKPKH